MVIKGFCIVIFMHVFIIVLFESVCGNVPSDLHLNHQSSTYFQKWFSIMASMKLQPQSYSIFSRQTNGPYCQQRFKQFFHPSRPPGEGDSWQVSMLLYCSE